MDEDSKWTIWLVDLLEVGYPLIENRNMKKGKNKCASCRAIEFSVWKAKKIQKKIVNVLETEGTEKNSEQ